MNNHDQPFLDYLHRIRNQAPTHVHEYIHLLFHINQYYQNTFVPTNNFYCSQFHPYYQGVEGYDFAKQQKPSHQILPRFREAAEAKSPSNHANKYISPLDIHIKHNASIALASSKKNLRDMPPLENPMVEQPATQEKITIECTIYTQSISTTNQVCD